MILGTAQLGQEYGIHNMAGKPDEKRAYQILDYAWHHGIHILDTAGAYGDAEALIGKYQEITRYSFQICTKLFVNEAEIGYPTEAVKVMERKLEESLNHLKSSQVWLCYLHQFSYAKEDNIIQRMKEWKRQGKVQNIGISIYEPKELEYILDKLSSIVDVVQIPFHLLNFKSWMDHNLLQRLKERNIKVFARSVFLQGLFFQNPDSDVAEQLSVGRVLQKLCQIAEEASISIGQIAVSFVAQHLYIDDFLLGCETVEQLMQDIILEKESKIQRLPQNILEEIADISKMAKEAVLDPREWKVG